MKKLNLQMKKAKKISKNLGQKIIKSPKTKLIYAVFSAITVAIFAFLSVVYITAWQFDSFGEIWDFITQKPQIMSFSFMVMLYILLILCSIIGNWRISIGVFYSLITVVMFINHEKLRSRNTPFLPEDLAMSGDAGNLSGMVNIWSLVLLILSVIAIMVFAFFIDRQIKKHLKIKFSKTYIWLFRILLLISAWALLGWHTEFIRTKIKGNYTKIDFLNTEINSYNQDENYKTNGFIVGTLFNLEPKKMDEPSNYSKKEVERIVKKYTKIAEEQNTGKSSAKDEKINIVYVMSESFIDPSLAKHIYDYGTKDPIPYTRQLIKSHTSGWAASSEYGGGTANVEFEALTGLSNYFLNVIPYSNIVAQNDKVPSIAKSLRQNGYDTIALHPYARTMYKRNSVYPNLGFKTFKSIENFDYTDKIDNSQYISDESAFNQTIKELKNAKNPAFVHLVTMQNHMPYELSNYNENPFPVESKDGASAEEAPKISAYLIGINKSDQAFEKFIQQINNLGEKTVVVFWGDHWPGIYGDMFGKRKELADIFRTPLLVYSNFQTDKINLGTQSLNYAQINALNAGNIKLSPYQYLLQDLQKSHPTLTKSLAEGDTNNDSLIHDYQIIEYDILSGQKWSAGKFYE